MSNWRSSFTFNKYSQIAARALRQSLKETERVSAEKRGNTILRYQEWKNGQAGQLVSLNPPVETRAAPKGPPVV